MFVFDSNEKPQAVDRQYLPGVVLRIYPLTRAEIAELKREAGGDKELLDKLILRRAVEDWPEGIVDPKGKKLPCTDENKDLVFDRFSQLAIWATLQTGSLAEAEAEKRGMQLKNLKRSRGGSGAGQSSK